MMAGFSSRLLEAIAVAILLGCTGNGGGDVGGSVAAAVAAAAAAAAAVPAVPAVPPILPPLLANATAGEEEEEEKEDVGEEIIDRLLDQELATNEILLESDLGDDGKLPAGNNKTSDKESESCVSGCQCSSGGGGGNSSSSSSSNKLCLTEDCVRAAATILSSIDRSADPCNDFYQVRRKSKKKSTNLQYAYHTVLLPVLVCLWWLHGRFPSGNGLGQVLRHRQAQPEHCGQVGRKLACSIREKLFF